jgi:hypothetical protein
VPIAAQIVCAPPPQHGPTALLSCNIFERSIAQQGRKGAAMKTIILVLLLSLPACALAQVNCVKQNDGKYACNSPGGPAKIQVLPDGSGLLERADGSAVIMSKQPNGKIKLEDTNGKTSEIYPQGNGKSTTFRSDGTTAQTYHQPNGTSTTYRSNGTNTTCTEFRNGNIQCK